ncbi:MAG: phytoene desaturase [Betaproteobacteria bacterium]|nr:phytoene desaturase [Betaproteobacteria bacterium]
MSDARVIVIGSGIAGLVSATQLAHQGYAVTLIEAADSPGGKIRTVVVDGAPIDSGPTVFTMRWIFDQIFDSIGTQLESEVKIDALEVIARHAWGDGARLDLYSEYERSLDAVAQFAGLEEAQNFKRFCEKIRNLYDVLQQPFIQSASPTMLKMVTGLGLNGLTQLASIGAMSNLWNSLGRYFKNPRLLQLFARYATYCGSSPWQAPATLMMIAQVEMDGVWSVLGGMHALARAFERLALARGVNFRYNTRVEKILTKDGRVLGVQLSGGEVLTADAVIFNGDHAALSEGLLSPHDNQSNQYKTPERSLSALTWSINAKTSGFDLSRHNIFFQNHYQQEFDDIFKHQRLPQTPTVYVCAQDRGTSVPVEGTEKLLCLVNAPAIGDTHQLTQEAIESCEKKSFALLSQCGLEIDRTSRNTVRTTPVDFHRLFPATGGALYGQATHGWIVPLTRQKANSHIKGLMLAGGSVHPGPGVPMAAMSGQLAAAAVKAHLSSTKKFHPVATYGGMSMR